MSGAAALFASLCAGTASAALLNDASMTKARKSGVVLLAYGAGNVWRTDMVAVRKALPGVPLESVESPNRVAIQRAIQRLEGQHAAKIVAIPLEPVSESPVMDQTRYLFGVREEPAEDRPDRTSSGMPALKRRIKSTLKLEDRDAPRSGGAAGGGQRLEARAELVLAESIDKSPALAAILADRAKPLSRRPAENALVLAGLAPRSEKALEAWTTAARAIAADVAKQAGFRESGVVWVRDGVPSAQRDQDAKATRDTIRKFVTQGGVVVVPLALDGGRIGQLLKRDAPGLAYRWDGKGVAGDARLTDWIRTTAEKAAKMNDSRQYKNDALRAGGFR